MKTEYANSRRTKKKIFVAYLQLLNEKAKINICSLCRRADVNRGTFYLHFKGGLPDVERQMEEQIANTFNSIGLDLKQADIVSNPELVFNKLNSILLKNEEYYRLILSLDGKMNLISKMKQFIIAAISSNFEVTKYVTNPENFKLAVQYIVGGVMDCYYEWLKGNISRPIEELSGYLANFVKEGLKGAVRNAN